ncbi:histamine H2 receptor-like [Uloborus diversus]|uniref:histamine H2 receptor-like n=1 Tax=Uloborus diversus TaxID=327109 RepID=UPI002408FC8E|nr:histamine H2 receptor-like [Uloborus diversus]
MNLTTVNTTLLLSDYNETFPEIYKRSFATRFLGSSVTIVLGCTAVLGNLAVVFASYWDKTLRNQASTLLLVYLAMTDVITGLITIIPAAVAVAIDDWPFDNTFCKLQNGLTYGCNCSSSLNISVISFDRIVAVTRPLQYRNIITTKRIIGFCIFLFLLAMTIALPALVLEWSHFNYIEGICAFDFRLEETKNFSTSWTFISCYYIPGLFMFVCNCVIIYKANKQKSAWLFIRRNTTVVFQQTSSSNKTIASVSVLVLTYCVTLAPYITAMNLAFSLDGFSIPPLLHYLLCLLVFISPAVNPFIYGIFRKDYRNAYKKIVPKSIKNCFGAS